MYVYKQTEPGLYTVGHYIPESINLHLPSQWIAESDWPTCGEASSRVHFLNGGNPFPPIAPPLPTPWAEDNEITPVAAPLKPVYGDPVDSSPKPVVTVVTFKPDPRVTQHGLPHELEHQLKLTGVNGETKWIDYPHHNIIYPQKYADWWAKFFGVGVNYDDVCSTGYGREGKS